MGIDLKLKEYGANASYIEAVNKHGGVRAAERALGLSKDIIGRHLRAVQRKAAMVGYSPEHGMVRTVPDGYQVRGVSTLYDGEGQVRAQWVKSALDRERHEELLKEFVEHLTEQAKGLAPRTKSPKETHDDLLACYLFGDPHLGMKAYADEAGEDFDLAENDRIHRAGVDRLLDATPAAEEAILLAIGDNTHANDGKHKTPEHGNPLDMDGHHNRSMLVSAKLWAYAAARLLEKHKRVRVWIMPGNHDPDAAAALAICLAMYFEDEPRIEVDMSPSLYKYHRFGRVLIGAHHGHGAKQGDLPLLMAVDRPEDWGKSVFRYIYMGHIHHDSVKEVQGVRVESIRTLAAKDAWHSGKGYRSLRDTRSIVLHKEFGEIERHTCSAAMLSK